MKRNRLYIILIMLSLVFSVRPACAGALGNTVEAVRTALSTKVRPKVKKLFADKGLNYPPKKIALIAVKDIDILEVWGRDNAKWVFVKKYPILAASGVDGPKLKRGDYQVPEGIYTIPVLNPNSSYHLSIKVNYPNKFDREMAKKDKRTRLGGDIFIHGYDASIGCLAMGDRAIEELFLMVADIKRKNVKVIIMPYDFRDPKLTGPKTEGLTLLEIFRRGKRKKPEWLPTLYDKIKKEVKVFK